MTWRSPFADGPCVVVVKDYYNDEALRQPVAAGQSVAFVSPPDSESPYGFTLAVSEAGEVSILGQPDTTLGFTVMVIPPTIPTTAMQVAGVSAEFRSDDYTIRSIELAGGEEDYFDYTELQLVGAHPTTVTPDPAPVPRGGGGAVPPVMWWMYFDTEQPG